MRNKILIILSVVLLYCTAHGTLIVPPLDSGQMASISTVQKKSKLVATVTADVSARDVNDEISWTDALTLCTMIPPEWSVVSLSFYGYGDGDGAGDPNGATFSFDVYVCDLYGGLERISTGNAGDIGVQQLSHDPVTGAELNSGAVSSNYRWNDTITAGTSYWSVSFLYSNYQGGNSRAKVKFNRHESYGIWVRIYNMTSQPVTSITCVMNGY